MVLQRRKLVETLMIVLLLVQIITQTGAVKLDQTQISPSRNPYRKSICDFYSTNFTDEERTSSQAIIDSYGYFTDAQIESMIYQHNLSPSFLTMLIVAPHAISFIVLCFLWPALCCCCAKPCKILIMQEKFPLCQKCRKPQKQMYTKIQLKWTSYIFIIFCISIVTGSLLALFQSTEVTNYYNNAACRFAAIFDDMQYGRVSSTNQTRFFVGLRPLASEMETFSSQLSTFFSDSNTVHFLVTKSLNASSQIRVRQSAFQSLIATEYNSFSNSVYTDAFTSDGTINSTVNSVFKDMYYGPLSRSSSILGNINSHEAAIFNQVNAAIDPMILAWARIEPKGLVGLTTQVTAAKLSINDTALKLDKVINETIAPSFDHTDSYNSINIALKVFYAIILVLGILMTLSAIILTFCTVVKIRLVIYCTCGFLIFLAFFSFFLLVFFAYAQPVVTQVCKYSDTQLSQGSTAKDFFVKLGFQDVGNYVQQCMSDGNGKMVGVIQPTFKQSFDDILTISSKTLNLNKLISLFSTTNLAKPFTQGAAVVADVKNSIKLDINDSISLNHIKQVGTKGWPIDVACATVRVNDDVWYPSFEANYVCPAGKNKHPPCSDLSNIGICPQGCYEIMNQIMSPSGDPLYATKLQGRYNAGCNYVDYIRNMHVFWNLPRITKMNQVQANLNTLKANLDNYEDEVQAVQASLNAFKTTLQTNFNSRINQTSGSFYGVDCRAIGQSIYQFRDAVCVGLVHSINYNLLSLGLICYGILFGACFATCAGVRHFKHLQRMEVHVGYKGVDMTVSENRILDK